MNQKNYIQRKNYFSNRRFVPIYSVSATLKDFRLYHIYSFPGDAIMLDSINGQSTSIFSLMQQSMQSVFNKSDDDGDGMLNKSEFSTFISSLAEKTGAASDTDAIFAEADADGDGLLSETEFETLMSSMPAPPEGAAEEQDTSAMFADTDTDGDGLVSIEEFEAAAPQGPPPPPAGGMMVESDEEDETTTLEDFLASVTADDEATTAVFNYLDTDEDGTVDIDEILAAFSQNVSAMYSLIQDSSSATGSDLDVSA